MAFDPEEARLGRFAGVRWHPDSLVDRGDHISPLLDLARHRKERCEEILQLVRTVFSGPVWKVVFGMQTVATWLREPNGPASRRVVAGVFGDWGDRPPEPKFTFNAARVLSELGHVDAA